MFLKQKISLVFHLLFWIMALSFTSTPMFAELNPAVQVSSLPQASEDNKKPVLIYYFNETAPDQWESHNISLMKSWLGEIATSNRGNHKSAQRYLEILEHDLNHFKVQGDLNIEQIRQQDFAAVIVSNTLARKSLMLVKQSGQNYYQSQKFEYPSLNQKHDILKSNILANSSTLGSVLDQAQKIFSSSKHTFALATKSHGDKKLLIRPKVMFDLAKIGKARFVKEFNAIAANPKSFASAPSQDLEQLIHLQVMVTDKGLGKLGEDREGEDREGPGIFPKMEDSLSETVGISKSEYVKVISEYSGGSKGEMSFTLLMADSCDSQVSQELLSKLASFKVRRFLGSNSDGLDYDTIKYAKIFDY